VAPTDREGRLESLAKEHSTAIANYLRRRLYPLSAAELDDLVEEVLIVVWRRIDVVPEGAELPWMIGVARNVLANARRRQRRRDAFTATLSPRGADASAEEYVVADLAVAGALGRLSEVDREVLVLHFWDGLDTTQLAVVLSVTANAAAVRLSRAQSRFRTLLETEKP
jgi:RNA polymerase sigma-70 factor, ECF subfamily